MNATPERKSPPLVTVGSKENPNAYPVKATTRVKCFCHREPVPCHECRAEAHNVFAAGMPRRYYVEVPGSAMAPWYWKPAGHPHQRRPQPFAASLGELAAA